jgi:hypothetical protein
MGENENGLRARVLELYIVHVIRILELPVDGKELRPKYARTIINKLANSGDNVTTKNKIIRKSLGKIRRKKSVGPNGVAGEILKLGRGSLHSFPS